MAIDRAQVRHVARLARLALSPEEEERFAAQLAHVLEYIERLQAVDVSGVEPLGFAGDAQAGVVMRADEVVGTYEDGWDRVRALGPMPRTVNFITGPSRTGDIEQGIQLGAHGPRRLHIVLVDGKGG